MVVNIQIKEIGILPVDKDCMIASLKFETKAQLIKAIHNILGCMSGPEFVGMMEEFNGQFNDGIYDFKVFEDRRPS